jgi:hypothetical protein
MFEDTAQVIRKPFFLCHAALIMTPSISLNTDHFICLCHMYLCLVRRPPVGRISNALIFYLFLYNLLNLFQSYDRPHLIRSAIIFLY